MNTVSQRIFSSLFVIWAAATLVFFALRVIPGDAIQSQLLQSGVSPTVIEQRRAEQGLSDPILTQYGNFLVGLIQGNLGYSLINGVPVHEMIGAQLLPTGALALVATLIATIAGVLMGIVTGTHTVRWLSLFCEGIVSLALSMPIYWSGTLAIMVFSVHLDLFPSLGIGQLSQLIVPAGVLGFHSAGAVARVVSASIREIAGADYVRTARAKGLPESLVLRRHILRVGLMNAVTVITVQLGFLLSGTIIIESLFVRPGIGRLLLDRTLQQDYPVVQGIVILSAVVYTVLNTIVDLTYQWIDPRVAVS